MSKRHFWEKIQLKFKKIEFWEKDAYFWKKSPDFFPE